MALALDDLELGLIASGVLPGIRGVSDVGPEYRNPYDLPLVIGDDIFDATGALCYVDNARVWRFRLSDNSSLLRIGKDAWLYPQPQQTHCFLAGPATRADIVIDLSRYRFGQEIYLENILPQQDPRPLPNLRGTVRVPLPCGRARESGHDVPVRPTRSGDGEHDAAAVVSVNRGVCRWRF